MRTEVKIGIIVGLFVIAGGIIFFVNQSKGPGGDVADVVPMDAPPPPVAGGPERTGPGRDKVPFTRHTPTGDRETGVPTPPLRGVTEDRPSPLGVGDRAGAARRTGEIGTPPGQAEGPTATPTSQPESLPPLTGAPGITTRPGEAMAARPTSPPGREPGVPIPPPPDSARETAGLPGRLPGAPRDSAATQYTIERGDTLSSIARRHYGDDKYWTRIRDANPGIEPRSLAVGQVIVLPPKEDVTGPAESTRPGEPGTAGQTRPAARRHTYVVERGNRLITIARNILKDESRWKEIWELNKSRLPDPENPNLVPVGLELLLPED